MLLANATHWRQLESCNQQNKQKAMYAYFEHSPLLTAQPALDLIGDVLWDNLNGLRAYSARGIFQAWTLSWPSPSPGGYCGPQATGKGEADVEQVLFSLWDHGSIGTANWLPALPLIPETDAPGSPGTPSCKRNCNDCAVHSGSVADDGSTGTQCKVFIPARTGQHLRVRVRRVGQGLTQEAYGRSLGGNNRRRRHWRALACGPPAPRRGHLRRAENISIPRADRLHAMRRV